MEHHHEARNVSSAWKQQATYYQKYLSKDKIGSIHTIVELGVDYGYSLYTFAHDYPNAHVFGVDNFSYGDSVGARDRIQKYAPMYGNITLIEGKSKEIGLSWRNSLTFVDIDVLHIDADHAYDSVKSDFDIWSKHVRPGGVVLFHDVESFPDDVGKFFSELPGEKTTEGNLGIWYKPS